MLKTRVLEFFNFAKKSRQTGTEYFYDYKVMAKATRIAGDISVSIFQLEIRSDPFTCIWHIDVCRGKQKRSRTFWNIEEVRGFLSGLRVGFRLAGFHWVEMPEIPAVGFSPEGLL